MPDNAEFLTVAETAALLKLNEQTVRNWIDAGKLPAFRVGRRVRIKRTDLDALLDAGYQPGRAAQDSNTAQAFWDGSFNPVPLLPGAANVRL